jgi:hypothetical protein
LKHERPRLLAQKAAEQLHKDTGAVFTITLVVMGLAGSPDDAIVMGGWVPDEKIAAAILRAAAESIDGGTAEIIDKRRA